MTFPTDRIGQTPSHPPRSAVNSPESIGRTTGPAGVQTTDTSGAGAVAGASSRSTAQLEASVREMLTSTRRVIPGTATWPPDEPARRQLVRTRKGFAYQNHPQYEAGTGGLYLPASTTEPMVCSDMRQVHAWLTELETMLSMAAPDAPSLQDIRSTLRRELLAANGDNNLCIEALGKAKGDALQYHDFTNNACYALLEAETQRVLPELSPQAAALTPRWTTRFINRNRDVDFT